MPILLFEWLNQNSDYFIFSAGVWTVLFSIHLISKRFFDLKFLNTTIITSTITILIGGYFWVNHEEKIVRNYHQERLLGIAPTYAAEFELLDHESLNEGTRKDNPTYLKLIEREKLWLSINPLVADIYTFKKNKDGKVVLIVDSETDYNKNGQFDGDKEQRTEIGEVYDSITPEIESAFSGVAAFMPNFYTDKWGTWISACVPLYNKQGKVDGVLGVDYPASALVEEIKNTRLTYIGYILMSVAIISIYAFYFRRVRNELRIRIETEHELEASRLAQARSARLSSLGEMAAGMAHEINNPLAIIQGKSGVIRKILSSDYKNFEEVKPKVMESLFKIEETTQRIARIIRGLKTFARDGAKDPPQKIAIRSLVEDAFSVCQEKFKSSGVEIRIDFHQLEDKEIECYNVELSQVFLNLLNNAFDAISKSQINKWIEIEVIQSQPDRITFFVTDSGPGIPHEIAERIMDPFFTTKGVGKGTGLGLSISKGIIEKHGGILRYDSTSKNTRFLIDIPTRQVLPIQSEAEKNQSFPKNSAA